MLAAVIRWVRTAEPAVYATTAAVTALVTAVALQLWRADLSVPFNYSGDALPTGAHFKTVIETGWYESQSLLSAPAGQTYNDFPTADNLHMLAPYLFRPFTSDWAVALNLYFLLGFLLIALAAVWFLRRVGVSRPLTVALATLYAIAPYHFIRGESHLWLGSYYAVPLAMGLLVMLLRGDRIWGRGPSANRVLSVLFSPSTRTALILLVLGSSSSYYSVFFIALLSFTGLIVLVRDGSWRRFLVAVGLGIGTVLVMLVNMFPDMLFGWLNGANPAGLARSRGETEFLALKFSQLILPWPGHRVAALGNLRQQYDAGYLALGEQPALGVVAAAGFLAAFVVIVLMVVARRRFSRDAATWQLVGGLSALVLFAFMCATIGGLSTLVSFLTSSLRGWNRMSIVIALLSLGIVGLLLDLGIRRLVASSKRTRAAFLSIPLAAALVVVGFVDQTPADVGDSYASTKASYEADKAWVASIEDTLDAGAMVLMLPYIPFPENSASNGVLASDQLVPYLHSTQLRWSNGGIKGRPTADWPGTLENYQADDLPTLASSAGFSAIVVDRSASIDGGVALEESLVDLLGETPDVSTSGRFAFFDLRDYRDGLASQIPSDELARIGALVTDPVMLYPAPDFYSGYDKDGNVQLLSGKPLPRFTLTNSRDEARKVTVSFTIASGVPDGSVTVTWPDGSTTTETSSESVAAFSKTLVLEPGSHLGTVDSVDLNGTAVEKIELDSLVVVQSEVQEFLDSRG
jgi:hypothetical protein